MRKGLTEVVLFWTDLVQGEGLRKIRSGDSIP